MVLKSRNCKFRKSIQIFSITLSDKTDDKLCLLYRSHAMPFRTMQERVQTRLIGKTDKFYNTHIKINKIRNLRQNRNYEFFHLCFILNLLL